MLPSHAAKEYAVFGSDHATKLMLDLANLANIGELVKGTKTFDFRLTEPERALEFAETHGLLWHGPKQVGTGELRESLRDWFVAGLELSVTMTTYSLISQSQEEGSEKGSAEPVRRYLRTLRDEGFLKRISLSDDDNELLEYVSIQLAERITRGMAECTPTFIAACGLLKDGTKVGEAVDFVFGNDPGSLVGAANYQLARLASRKKPVRWCEECGEMLVPIDPRQRYHRKCGNRKRKREERQKRKMESSR